MKPTTKELIKCIMLDVLPTGKVILEYFGEDAVRDDKTQIIYAMYQGAYKSGMMTEKMLEDAYYNNALDDMLEGLFRNYPNYHYWCEYKKWGKKIGATHRLCMDAEMKIICKKVERLRSVFEKYGTTFVEFEKMDMYKEWDKIEAMFRIPELREALVEHIRSTDGCFTWNIKKERPSLIV